MRVIDEGCLEVKIVDLVSRCGHGNIGQRCYLELLEFIQKIIERGLRTHKILLIAFFTALDFEIKELVVHGRGR
jgi:hypothetical protein